MDSRVNSTIFDNLALANPNQMLIDPPGDLPPAIATKLNQYNKAIKRFDIQEAEQAADEVLEWLYRYGAAWM